MVWSIPLVSCHGCVPSQPLAHPWLIHCGRVEGKKKESLDAVQALIWNNQNSDVLSTLFSQIQNTAPYRLLGRKLTPPQPDPVHLLSPQLRLVKVPMEVFFGRSNEICVWHIPVEERSRYG